MPKYLLSVWHDEEYVVDFTTDDMMRIGPQVGAFNEELTAAGALVFADGLQPASTSTVFAHAADHSVSTAPLARWVASGSSRSPTRQLPRSGRERPLGPARAWWNSARSRCTEPADPTIGSR